MLKSEKYIELVFPVEFDAGELVGSMQISGFRGAWNDLKCTRVYWCESEWSDRLLEHICSALRDNNLAILSMDVVIKDVPVKDWNEVWSASVSPLWIGKKILIRPSWHPVPISQGVLELVIDPRQAFGTGHHATTKMLIEWIEDIIRGGEKVFDVGTGSGILAMVALRCGASFALGIDSDPVAVSCAKQYAHENGFLSELFLQEVALEAIAPDKAFNVILANLDARTILASCHMFKKFLDSRGTVLLVSGILVTDRTQVYEAMIAEEWVFLDEREEEKWLAMLFRI